MSSQETSYEMIELKTLSPCDKLDGLDLTKNPKGGHRLERTNAVRIPPGRAPLILHRSLRRRVISGQDDTVPPGKIGKGHYFQPTSHTQYTWCDLCGDFIWGIYRKSLRCAYCSFTCHYRCRALIRLDCSKGEDADSDSDLSQDTAWEKDTNVDEKPEKQPPALSQKETEQMIKDYNSKIKSNLFMSMNKDGSYTGFIKVQLKLIRPVSVPVAKKPSCNHERRGAARSQQVKRRTSFYLPKDASKHLHLSSRTPASEVIQALLRKFTVLDNPRKFALFQRTEKDSQVCMRKISDDEEPLKLRLLSGPCEKTLSFILKENETGEVNWDAFSMPELKNFLRILQREEEEHMRQILQRYARCRQQMQEALASRTPG
ncbi:ras association domain-containing protein 1 isoform X1 [Hyla sarda]|uniref:ras association domain-containing protein 1 isoform X1 n=1 Tax=Hyla sarda TaxID=327740 RepID=UPI0024C3E2B1|nr:ras association domain-containing protein 1 isoform X1 [Hyla sarda]